jgi:UDP-2,4-diacetamido-2,4,6-trideoxy-beta-L-altropyranose hydrolase
MKIIFRVDASVQMGTGHVMRCLTLADSLRGAGAGVFFICRELPGHLCDFIDQKGYNVYRLPYRETDTFAIQEGTKHAKLLGVSMEADAEATESLLKRDQGIQWLIVDHYGIDKRWEARQRPYIKKIMVIDDLADRQHDCDVLLDQNYYEQSETRYDDLVPDHCKKLLGPKYVLLRPEFSEARKNLRNRDGIIRRILVFFGGADPENVTKKALEAVHLLNRPDIAVDVVVGSSNPHKENVKLLCVSMPNTHYYCQVENMAKMMFQADLCIGAGGSSVWERCSVALPSLVIAIAENQIQMIEIMAKDAFLLYGGWYKNVTVRHLNEDLQFLLRHRELLSWFSVRSQTLVDGNGTSRVQRLLQHDSESLQFRRIAPTDSKRVYEWRNHPEVRKYSFNSSFLEWEEHKRWFEKQLQSNDTIMLMAVIKNTPIGVLRYDFNIRHAKVSMYLDQSQIGIGIGANVLRQGNKWLKETYPEIESVNAEIMAENAASIKTFERAGFKKKHTTYSYSFWEDLVTF